MLRRIAVTLLTWMGSVACTATVPHVAAPADTSYVDGGLGLALHLPPGWQIVEEQGARVFSGPSDTPTFYTTLVLQSRNQSVPDLTTALNDEFTDLAQKPRFMWRDRQAVWLDDDLGLSYTLTFEYNDVARLRTGILFYQQDNVVDLSYNAPLPQVPTGLDVYLAILNDLTRLPVTAAPSATGVAHHL